MRSVNEVMLLGNVGKDPDVRSLQSGACVASFSMATTRKWNTQAGEAQEKTEWHHVSAWNSARGPKHADLVEQYVKKGSRILVRGRIEYRSYEKDGQKRYTTEIIATELIFLDKREASDAPAATNSGNATPYRTAAKPSGDFDDFPGALEDNDDDSLPF